MPVKISSSPSIWSAFADSMRIVEWVYLHLFIFSIYCLEEVVFESLRLEVFD